MFPDIGAHPKSEDYGPSRDKLTERSEEELQGSSIREQKGRSTEAPAFPILEATAGFEPAIRVLQTPALPLGHVALIGSKANESINFLK